MKIYVITHKKYKFPSTLDSSIYIPLLVGADTNIGENYYLKDNNFKGNISYKNKNYCELTGYYAIWKQSEEDIIGICHYRRYFTKNRYLLPQFNILNKEDIRSYLTKFDCIVPEKRKRTYGGLNAKQYFIKNHGAEAWDICEQTIKTFFPSYFDDWKWLENQHDSYNYNMIILHHELFDAYCNWLFAILANIESSINMTQYDSYNSRMFGFLSERLLNVWIHHNSLKVKECPIYNTEVSILDLIILRIKRLKKII